MTFDMDGLFVDDADQKTPERDDEFQEDAQPWRPDEGGVEEEEGVLEVAEPKEGDAVEAGDTADDETLADDSVDGADDTSDGNAADETDGEGALDEADVVREDGLSRDDGEVIAEDASVEGKTADDGAEGSDDKEDAGGEGEEGAGSELGQADGDEIQPMQIIEAVLFATDEPVSPQKLVEILGVGGVKEVREHIDVLNQAYEEQGRAFRVEAIAGGYLMLTQSRYNPWLKKLLKVRSETKLSPAALETLAIIAYKQPILRVDIESIRGVAAGEMIRQLTEKGLVKIVGRAEVIGRPLLYGTTRKFLEVFGLNSLKDLPTAEELNKPEGA